jgi:hypothetical protein
MGNCREELPELPCGSFCLNRLYFRLPIRNLRAAIKKLKKSEQLSLKLFDARDCL